MKLAEIMDKKKVTADELAAVVGVTSGLVRLWRHGVHSPRLLHALMVKKYFKRNIKLEELLTEKDRKLLEG